MIHGTVVAAYGKRYDVELQEGSVISCVTRGKKSELACGDRVSVKTTSAGEGVIEQFNERISLLYRSNEFRKKLLAANVTQMILVVAARPSFYPELLDRALIAAETEHTRAIILLNKCDLPESREAMEQLKPYANLGYTVIQISAHGDLSPLQPWLQGQTSILVGQSGMGKSTLVNALLPDAKSRTREISSVLDSGKHTTTAAHLYHLDHNSHLIDSPGLQEFGLSHLSFDQIEHGFIEFRPYLGKCRFNNCRHASEPGCAIHAAVECGKISAERLACFHRLAGKPA